MITIQVEEKDLFRFCAMLQVGQRMGKVDLMRGPARLDLQNACKQELAADVQLLESIQAQIPEDLRPFERLHE
jgi:hypothetical protein